MPAKRLDALAARVRNAREDLRWSQEDLAEEAAVSRSWVKKLELAQMKNPGTNALMRVAEALKIPKLEVLDLAGTVLDPALRHSILLENYQMLKPVLIPVVDIPAHAGHGGTPAVDYVYVEPSLTVNRNLVCVPVRGRCMEPRIEDGDRVIVDRDRWPERGDMVVAVVEEAVLVRRFYPSNSHITLRTDAPGYDDIEVTELAIVGVVIEIRKRP